MTILGETNLPARWGDLPGYDDEPLGSKKLPPYTEDLGHGSTHRVGLQGDEEWRLHGQLHRDNDLPAVTRPGGYQAWYQHGQLHRGGGKPAVIAAQGGYEYYLRGVHILPVATPDQLKAWGYYDHLLVKSEPAPERS